MAVACIPTIDLAAWTSPSSPASARAAQASTWHRAFASHGLVWVVGHGAGPLHHRVAREWAAFCRLEPGEKDRWTASR